MTAATELPKPVGMPSDAAISSELLATIQGDTTAATEPSVVRLVVTILGLVAVSLVLGLLILTGREADPVALGPIQVLAGTVVGALASLLVSTRSRP